MSCLRGARLIEGGSGGSEGRKWGGPKWTKGAESGRDIRHAQEWNASGGRTRSRRPALKEARYGPNAESQTARRAPAKSIPFTRPIPRLPTSRLPPPPASPIPCPATQAAAGPKSNFQPSCCRRQVTISPQYDAGVCTLYF